MDPTSAPVNPAELFELLGIVGGVGASGLVGFLLVRRAPRRAGSGMIDGVGEAPAPRLREPKARKLEAAERARRRARSRGRGGARSGRGAAPPEPEAAPRGAARPAAPAQRRSPTPDARRARARRPPRSSRSAGPRAPRASARGARARPGAHALRLRRPPGRDLRGQEGDRSVGRRRDREGAADRRHRRAHQPEAAGGDPQLAVAQRAGRSRRGLGVPAPAQPPRCCRCPRRPSTSARARPFVLLIIGVNGSGKTTTIGKLAAKLAADGKKVLLAAGDTFRAAAAEQLDVWAKRACGDAGARQGGRRPVVGDLRRRQARRDRRIRRRRSPTPPAACTPRPT